MTICLPKLTPLTFDTGGVSVGVDAGVDAGIDAGVDAGAGAGAGRTTTVCTDTTTDITTTIDTNFTSAKRWKTETSSTIHFAESSVSVDFIVSFEIFW